MAQSDVPIFGRIKPRYTRVCLLCLTFNCFLSFFSQSNKPSIVPPYAPRTNASVRIDPLHPPHPTPRRTSNKRICLHTSAEIQRYDMRIPICTMATNGSASAASEIEEGSFYLTMQELRAAAAKQADTRVVAGVACCGMWRGPHRTSAFA